MADEIRQYTAGGGPPNWDLLPEHMRSGVKEYIERGIPQGDFLTAIIRNDLKESFRRADMMNIHRIGDFVKFFYRHAPVDCWGSPGKHTRWMEQGGLDGKTQSTT